LFVHEGGSSGGYALLRSDDGARTWRTAYRVAGPASVYTMTYDPVTPNRVYLAFRVS